MIVEQRDYHVFTGKLNEVVSMYETEGIELQSKHLGTLVGGESLGGLFYTPTVITGVAGDAAMACEETFGPVAGIARFEAEEEAVRQANATPYGLASYFYSRDVGRIWRVSEALEFGIVGINTGVISTEVAPFGGVKESGIGREGSKYGMEEFLEVKYLCMGGIDK